MKTKTYTVIVYEITILGSGTWRIMLVAENSRHVYMHAGFGNTGQSSQ